MGGRLLPVALALSALMAGFAVDASTPGAALGEAIAHAIAVLAQPVLGFLGTDLVRNGVELRAATGGWAVRVSDVCDGMGLIVTLAAGLLALGVGRHDLRWGLRHAALGIALIEVFNFVRVLALTLAMDRWPTGFGVLHDQVFPLATVAVIGAALVAPQRLLRFGLLVLPLAALWAWTDEVLSPLLVPPANLLLTLAPPEVGTIAERAAGWSVGTFLVSGFDPLRLFLAPLDPRHFTLAVPLILAAVALTRRGWWLVPAGLSMLLALCAASVGAVWTLAAAQAPVPLLLPGDGGAFTPVDFTPDATARAVLRLVQNTLVHFNALLLCFIILDDPRRPRAGV